jgi:hypothetical protein
LSLVEISVISCVNNFAKYDHCVRNSFAQEQASGTAELIPIDNTSNNYSAAMALNIGIKKASSNILVLCHQDVIFPEKWIAALFEQICVIEKTHKNWGVLGTYGIARNGSSAGHIIDCGVHFYCPSLPVEVQSLDEHCLIMRRNSGLGFDEELGGFHLYGADICIEAMAKGMVNFAIDACVQHMSPGGIVDAGFHKLTNRLYQKWKDRNPPLPVIETTCKMCRLQGGLKGIVAYRLARFMRKRRRKKMRKLQKHQQGL